MTRFEGGDKIAVRGMLLVHAAPQVRRRTPPQSAPRAPGRLAWRGRNEQANGSAGRSGCPAVRDRERERCIEFIARPRLDIVADCKTYRPWLYVMASHLTQDCVLDLLIWFGNTDVPLAPDCGSCPPPSRPRCGSFHKDDREVVALIAPDPPPFWVIRIFNFRRLAPRVRATQPQRGSP